MKHIEKVTLMQYLKEVPEEREFYEIIDRLTFDDDDSIRLHRHFKHLNRRWIVEQVLNTLETNYGLLEYYGGGCNNET